MGRRGPPPKPTSIRSDQFRRTRGVPEPSAEVPKCPTFLTPIAKHEWRRVIPELERLGLLTLVDRTALAGYCQEYARWRQAEEIISQKGLTYKTASGAILPRPEVQIAFKSLLMIKAFCAEFGFTPSSRSRMPAGRVQAERPIPYAVTDDPADDPRRLLTVVS